MKHLAILLLVLLGACAPRLQPPGTDNVSPALGETAMVMNDGITLPLR